MFRGTGRNASTRRQTARRSKRSALPNLRPAARGADRGAKKLDSGQWTATDFAARRPLCRCSVAARPAPSQFPPRRQMGLPRTRLAPPLCGRRLCLAMDLLPHTPPRMFQHTLVAVCEAASLRTCLSSLSRSTPHQRTGLPPHAPPVLSPSTPLPVGGVRPAALPLCNSSPFFAISAHQRTGLPRMRLPVLSPSTPPPVGGVRPAALPCAILHPSSQPPPRRQMNLHRMRPPSFKFSSRHLHPLPIFSSHLPPDLFSI